MWLAAPAAGKLSVWRCNTPLSLALLLQRGSRRRSITGAVPGRFVSLVCLVYPSNYATPDHVFVGAIGPAGPSHGRERIELPMPSLF